MSGFYTLGQLVRVTGAFTVGTVPTDPDAVQFLVKAPGVATVTYTYPPSGAIVRDGVGLFHADVSATATGTWSYRWTSTGSTCQASSEGNFTIQDSPI